MDAQQAAARIREALEAYERAGNIHEVVSAKEAMTRYSDLRAILDRMDDLAKDAARLREALMSVTPFVATEIVESCNGNKCREVWCAGCCGQESASAAIASAFDALAKARAALTNKD
jgi:chemotaxis methyl-accepting protein methylase